jgi:hypothetical protein
MSHYLLVLKFERVISCTRWAELTESLKFHVELAQVARTPTEFRLLNGSAPVTLGASYESDQAGAATLFSAFSQSAGGGTPLCYHINQIVQQITAVAPQLRAAGQKAAVIIATDGEASDGDVAAAMAPLCQLPVWVTVRLCTDDSRVVEYWASIDNQIEMEIDVIDDFLGEGREITKMNSWLNYGEPLHRLRELGISMKEVDLLDERLLPLELMRNMCCTM